jgi:hypothetical protein
MANKVYASPGVYTSEKDLTFTTETIGVTTLGLVGETQKGPAFQPMFIKNYDQFKVTFGGQNPEKFRDTQIVKYELPYIANRYLTQSNQLFVTRVLGLSGHEGGMAYAIRTIGSIDQSTLAYTTTQHIINFEVDVTANAPGTFYVQGTSTELSDEISTLSNVATSKFDMAYYKFFNVGVFNKKDWYKNNALYWGILDSSESAAITADRNSQNLTGYGAANPVFVDAYELPIGIRVSD